MTTPPPPGLTITAAWDRPLVPATGGEATLLVRVAAPPPDAATRRAPIDVAFVLDRSGSMAGEKLDLAKRAVDLAVGRLRDEDRAALVVYDDHVDLLQPLGATTPRAKTALRLALHGVDAGGSTNLGGGWLAGCRELSEAGPAAGAAARTPRPRRAILLTDGLANAGIVDPTELTRHAAELRKRGIATTALGLGLGFDEALLAGMAEAGGGEFGFAATASDLPAFFARELHELLTLAASGLRLDLTLPEGGRAEIVSAVPHDRRGERFEIAVGDLRAGDEREMVVAVRVAAGTTGAAHPLRLDASWSDPTADARRVSRIDLPPLILTDPESVAATDPDPRVAERAALQRAAAVRREALALDRAGRHADARDGMRRAATYLAAAPQTAEIRGDLAATRLFAGAAPDAAYHELDRKRAAFHNARRVRGRRLDPTPAADPADGRPSGDGERG